MCNFSIYTLSYREVLHIIYKTLNALKVLKNQQTIKNEYKRYTRIDVLPYRKRKHNKLYLVYKHENVYNKKAKKTRKNVNLLLTSTRKRV